MIVVDTCVWIESLQNTTTGEHYRDLWTRDSELIVPTVVQFELRRWCTRISGETAAQQVISATRRYQIQPLTEQFALQGALLAKAHGLAALDALIYATAQTLGAQLVSCDAHFEGLPQVDYWPKVAP